VKHLKMLGLAVVAAAALTAFIGAGTASATELCSTATTPCSGTKYLSGTAIEATSTKAVLVTNITTVTCTHSVITGDTTSSGGSGVSVTGKTTSLTFTGCTDSNGEPCTVTQNAVGNASVSGGTASATGKFSYNVTSKTGASVTCFGLKCNFSLSSATLPGQNSAGGTPTIKAENVELTRESGFEFLCPTTSTWTATYTIIKPDPLFVV
jgi:hypothetical protein